MAGSYRGRRCNEVFGAFVAKGRSSGGRESRYRGLGNSATWEVEELVLRRLHTAGKETGWYDYHGSDIVSVKVRFLLISIATI